MEDIPSEGRGFTLISRDGALFIRYDNGHLATQMREDQITTDEAERAKKSEEDAY